MKQGLIVVDCLRDFIELDGALNCGEDGLRAVEAMAGRLERHRRQGDLVVYACDRHLPDDWEFKLYPPHCVAGTRGAEIVPALAPRSGELVLPKRRFSAFFGTDLDMVLREHGIEEIELVGVCTNICVLYTAADARMRAYEVTVAAPAVASFDRDAHRRALDDMREVLHVRVEETL